MTAVVSSTTTTNSITSATDTIDDVCADDSNVAATTDLGATLFLWSVCFRTHKCCCGEIKGVHKETEKNKNTQS